MTETANSGDGLICSYEIPKQGEILPRSWETLEQPVAENSWVWIHLDRKAEKVQDWLHTKSGLNPHVIQALLTEETRPRVTEFPEGTMMIMRGVNLNKGENPEHMISVRVWVEDNRIISLRHKPLKAMQEIRHLYDKNQGPRTQGGFIVMLINNLVEKIAEAIEIMNEKVDLLEDLSQSTPPQSLRPKLIRTRHKIIPFRSYLSPQKEALAHLIVEDHFCIDEHQKSQLREIYNRLTLYIEDLDAMRDRTALVQDTISNNIAEKNNRTILLLSIVTSIFLPLHLLTGLFGMNVKGIPGESSYAFWIICGLIVCIVGVQLWLFRKLKII